MNNDEKKKSSKYIYIVEKGEKRKSDNIKIIDANRLEYIINELNSAMISIGLDKFIKDTNKKSFLKNSKFNLIIKKFSRGRERNTTNLDVNINESFRSRYGVNDIKNFTDIYKKSGDDRKSFVLSLYDSGDKILYALTDFTRIIFTKKADIRSDSRLVSMKYKDFEVIYRSKEPIKKVQEKNIIKETILFSSDTIQEAFMMLNENWKTNKNSAMPELLYDTEKCAEKLWKENSFLKLKRDLKSKKNGKINDFIGELGEFIAFNKLLKLYENDKKLVWESKIHSKSPYDISYNNEYFWEVKTTRTSSTQIILSFREKEFMDSNAQKWKMLRIDLKDFLVDVDFELLDSWSELEKVIDSKEIEINYLNSENVTSSITGVTGYRMKV